MIREYVILTGYLYSAAMALFLFLTWIICYANDGRLVITIGNESSFELMILAWFTVLSFTGLFWVFKSFLNINHIEIFKKK